MTDKQTTPVRAVKTRATPPASRVRRSRDDRIFYAVSYGVVILLTLIVLYPLVYIVSCSFSSANAVSTGKVVLLPVEPSVMGYQKVFELSLIHI